MHVVWEVTLACDLECLHCGSRAGRRRPDELSTAEAHDVIDQLGRLGVREVTLIGGEVYLRGDWVELVAHITELGMLCTLQTGARMLTAKRIAAGIEAGLGGIGVSVDGLEPLHDRLRGVPGSWAAAMAAIRRVAQAGLPVTANTQISAEVMADLPALMVQLAEAGASHWQIQLTVAMGNAVDNDAVLLQPWRLVELFPLLARLDAEGRELGLLMVPGNNLGYFGPYEDRLRGSRPDTPDRHWSGCFAGENLLALEADGTIKGCPSLATDRWGAGTVRDLQLEELWRAGRIRSGRRDAAELRGYCGGCYYAEVCGAGCTWTSGSLLGRPGDNPYCHHRALELARHGWRERIAKRAEAPQASFATGLFELIREPIPGATPTPVEPTARRPTALTLCRGCQRHVGVDELTCPFCAVDIAEATSRWEAEEEAAQQAWARLRALLEAARVKR